jgi:hypothetical protein
MLFDSLHSRIYFLAVVGHTQLLGCAPPTQTLGLQILTLAVVSSVPALFSGAFVVVISATFFPA